MFTWLENSPKNATVVATFQQGLSILLFDDNDRENEADIVAVAENITIETMALTIREGSGIVCLCLSEAIVDELALSVMEVNNESRYQIAFTVSIGRQERA